MGNVTVHMIGKAHLDPVWLWHWQRGADEALATCRAACDLLDDYPEVIFTRGEAWVHEQVRRLDPALFQRIRGHVQAGRWSVVNGWWVQPDANLPTIAALQATARLGQAWFREHLGLAKVPVAYLVDTFGHSAGLPKLLLQAGQPYFVMMRPMENEKYIPSCLFRWRGPEGDEVLTYRIPGSYCCDTPGLEGHIQHTINTPRPAGVDHVMCFYGIGNHGGGPTRKSVEWIRAHRDFAQGVRLEFSSPDRFFAAVEGQREQCPIVQDELQMHAIGCYSVCGALKRDLRRVELAAADADALLARGCAAAAPAPLRAELDEAWRTICFNQFHDILPGSATAAAVAMARQQVGGAQDRIETATYDLLRTDRRVRTCTLPGQRIHAVNRTGQPWKGLVEFELWLDWQTWNHQVADARGQLVPFQMMTADSLMRETTVRPVPRLLFPLELAAHEAVALHLVPDSGVPARPAGPLPRFVEGRLENGRVTVAFGPAGVAQVAVDGTPRLRRALQLVALADGTDTWSHGADRYIGPVQALADFGAPQVVENGPLRATVRLEGRIGRSPTSLYVSLDHGATRVDLRLHTNYREDLTVLKASVAPELVFDERQDRIMGGWFTRPGNGCEHPAHHATTVTDGRQRLGLLFPDSFALDSVAGRCLRVTLLRNSVHAYHSGSRIPQEEIPELHERFGTDEGPQELRCSLAFDEAATESALDTALAAIQQPPWLWDDYRGGGRLARFE